MHQVTIERHGDEIATVADEGELDLSYNTVIPARHIVPGTEMVVEVDPDGVIPQAPGSVMRFPAAGAEPLNVVEVPPMEVTVVPVLEAAEPDSSIFDWTRGLSRRWSPDGPLPIRVPIRRHQRQGPGQLRDLARSDQLGGTVGPRPGARSAAGGRERHGLLLRSGRQQSTATCAG